MTIQPLFVIGALRSLDLGEQIVVSLALGLTVIYLFRGRKTGRRIVGAVGTVWLVSVGVFGVGALAVAFGWVDPQPAAFAQDVIGAGSEVIDAAVSPAVEFLASRVDLPF